MCPVTEIALCLIATVEGSCQMITGTAWGCSLSDGSDEQTVRWLSASQPFVYWTVWLKAVLAGRLCKNTPVLSA